MKTYLLNCISWGVSSGNLFHVSVSPNFSLPEEDGMYSTPVMMTLPSSSTFTVCSAGTVMGVSPLWRSRVTGVTIFDTAKKCCNSLSEKEIRIVSVLYWDSIPHSFTWVVTLFFVSLEQMVPEVCNHHPIAFWHWTWASNPSALALARCSFGEKCQKKVQKMTGML